MQQICDELARLSDDNSPFLLGLMDFESNLQPLLLSVRGVILTGGTPSHSRRKLNHWPDTGFILAS